MKDMKKGKNEKDTGMSYSTKMFLLSALWTFTALVMMAIGFFGAEYISGMV